MGNTVDNWEGNNKEERISRDRTQTSSGGYFRKFTSELTCPEVRRPTRAKETRYASAKKSHVHLFLATIIPPSGGEQLIGPARLTLSMLSFPTDCGPA
jgi:hypothetical protein